MQAVKQQIRIPASRELCIQLPADALAETEAEVIVLFQTLPATPADELAEMREAMNAPLFVADLREVTDDFQHAG
jgi:hypothetical protein